MIKLEDFHPQYITDEQGEKSAVIIPMPELEPLIEDIEDLAALAERRDEPTTGQREVVARLKKVGVL